MRLEIGGHVLRLVPDANAPEPGWMWNRSRMLLVDGVHRGNVIYKRTSNFQYHDKGYHLFDLIPSEVKRRGWQGSLARNHTLERLLAQVPDLIAAGRLPTPDEVPTIAEDMRVKLTEELRQEEEARLAREAGTARAIETQRARIEKEKHDRAEMLEALQSIRDRLATDLTNYETDGLLRAIKALA